MPHLYDSLIRLGLKPGEELECNQETDSLMRVRGRGVRKLVARRFWVNKYELHVSMIPNDNGVVETALVSTADERKRPGFWHVILDSTGRPVAEHPLTYSTMKMNPSPPAESQAAEPHIVETTGDLTRVFVSWLVGYDRVNDEASAIILEMMSAHSESPREVKLEIKTRRIAQRLHDELLCLEDDVSDLPVASVQASELRGRVALLLKSLPV